MGETRTRVFVVEDEPGLLKSLLKMLSMFPELELTGSALDGAAALASIPRAAPDLVLLDLELPSMNGIEVTRALKRCMPRLEVLILTSFDDEQKVYEAMQAGASGYLVKRVGAEQIRKAIGEVIAGGTIIEAAIARRFWNLFQSVKAEPQGAGGNAWGLTAAELDMLGYMAKGLSNAEVGEIMKLRHRTIRTQLAQLYRKMGVSSHVDAVVAALRTGAIDL